MTTTMMTEQVHAEQQQQQQQQMSIFDWTTVLLEAFIFVTSEVFLLVCAIVVTLNDAYDRFDQQMCRVEETIARFPSRITCYLRETLFMAPVKKFIILMDALRGSSRNCRAPETEFHAAEEYRKEQQKEMERQQMQRARILAQQQQKEKEQQRQYEAKQNQERQRTLQQARKAEHRRQTLVLDEYVRCERARLELREKQWAEQAKHRVLEPLVKSQAQIDREIALWNDVNRPNVNEERRLKFEAAKAAREAAAQRKEVMRREEMARMDVTLQTPQLSFVAVSPVSPVHQEFQAAQPFMATAPPTLAQPTAAATAPTPVAQPVAAAAASAPLSDEEAAAARKAARKAKKLAREAKEKAEKEQLEYLEKIFA
uniref:Uncharacterized protein n=1 Tax=Amphora coffeiformis TaxID=265554 RepID=A0A7S3P6U8_9STRA